jgi:hypothetical protein
MHVNPAEGDTQSRCAPRQETERRTKATQATGSRRRELKEKGERPRFLRDFLWTDDDDCIGPSTKYSLDAEPVPVPPPDVCENEELLKTVKDHPHLFRIVTPINVDALEHRLKKHPNQPFVKSVLRSLRFGFWPWAETDLEGYPSTWDNSHHPLKTEREMEFVQEQTHIEEQAGRFSPPFGPDLLPGMYSVPIHTVPKPGSDKLRLVVDHSDGCFSLNSMIEREHIAGVKLDGIRTLGASIRAFRAKNPNI